MSSYGSEDAPNPSFRSSRVDGKIWTPNHTQLHLSVDNERQTHGVLLAPKEPLRPVNRIDSPHSCSPRNEKSTLEKIDLSRNSRPSLPPGWFPLSIASNSSSVLFTCPGPIPHVALSPSPSSAVNASLASSTILSLNKLPSSARRSDASSSPTIGSPGNAWWRIELITAWAA